MKRMASRQLGPPRRIFDIKASRQKAATVGRVGSSRNAFTLLELMIAVAILVVVIIATSQIFGTVGKVAALGEATADVLQEAAAIERQIRADIERLSSEGIFAIRCVNVRNGIHLDNGGPLINPLLPEDAIIRADQLVFFTNGIQGIQTYRQGAGTNHKGQGTAARIYYGHAFQIPGARAVEGSDPILARDPIVDLNNPLVPWYYSTARYGMVKTKFFPNVSDEEYTTLPGGGFKASQPTAQEWLLARQAILLVDDGGSEVVYLNNNRSAYTIADAVVRNGRVDAAASQLNDIRNEITLLPNGNFREWYDPSGAGTFRDQRTVIADNVLFYPRAERIAPSMHRVDQALTNNVLGSGCSSFIVDWTYEDGVGFKESPNSQHVYKGVNIRSDREQPWFGLDADFNGDGNLDRGVSFYQDEIWWDMAQTMPVYNSGPVPDNNIEQLEDTGTNDLQIYQAFFGYNQSQPFNDSGFLDSTLGYTPWPSAIRITMVLHDPKSKLENGRVVQFVINLPKRAQ